MSAFKSVAVAKRGGEVPDHDSLFPTTALYVHIPFCARKCFYCDFPSFAGQDDAMEAYVKALREEISAAPRLRVRTIFFGGGTPSYLPAALLGEILADILAHFEVLPGAEITMEANPGNERLRDGSALDEWRRYREMGFNRVSLGVQSFDADVLQALGRIHRPEDALDAVRAARSGGFERLSIDLMYGLPGQTLETWRDTLMVALSLRLPHVSAYSLIVEPHTPFEMAERQGRLPLPDENTEREMARLVEVMLSEAGYDHYEVSNWALPGCESQHNQVYWRNEPWLGFGSGAHSYWGRRRWSNPSTITKYLSDGPAVPPSVEQALHTEQEETMFMGLRLLKEGMSNERFEARFGCDLQSRYGTVIDDLASRALVTFTDGRLCLTPEGLPLANEVFGAFLDC